MLAEVLALDGHHVDTAPDGAAASTKIAARDYDLIISEGRIWRLYPPGW